jgi:hypothetical protein
MEGSSHRLRQFWDYISKQSSVDLIPSFRICRIIGKAFIDHLLPEALHVWYGYFSLQMKDGRIVAVGLNGIFLKLNMFAFYF